MMTLTSLARIDRTSPIPLHEQCKHLILQQIERGVLKPGDALPPERVLCEDYGLSRTTVRSAVSELVQQGILRRAQGQGTFVTKRSLPLSLHTLTSFSEDMRARGKTPSAKVLFLGLVLPQGQVANALGVDGQVMVLERLRFADGEMMGLQKTYLPAYMQVSRSEIEQAGSLHELLARRYHLEFSTADETLEADIANKQEAALLGVPTGAPILHLERLSYDIQGEPKEFSVMRYRADQYTYYARLTRQ